VLQNARFLQILTSPTATMETRRSIVRQAGNNEPLVGITIPREQVKKKYSGINSIVKSKAVLIKDRYRKI
jgi:hypothetical protein